MTFSSAQLGGVFSNRTADAAGQVSMTWQCGSAGTVVVTAQGLTSGRSVTFDVIGVAPPIPDAPIGSMFDARSAPSLSAMTTWMAASPFRGVGVYIPVNSAWDNRSDKQQTNLTPSWVTSVLAQGWSIAPIYVGRQAPAGCQSSVFHRISTDSGVAYQQGIDAAVDAAASANALGMGPGSPIYYDLEAYTPGCELPIRSFLDGWTEQLHAQGYVSGVYGSRSSTMADLVTSTGRARV